MKVLLAGPIDTSAVGLAINEDLSALPSGTNQTPLALIAAGLLNAGHEVHLVTQDGSIDETQHFHFGRVTITFCPRRTEPRFRARVRSRDLFALEIKHLTAAIRRSDACIVHAHWTYEYTEAALRSRRPMLATMHDLGWECLFLFRDIYRAVRLIINIRAMVRVKYLSVVAPFMARKAWQYGFLRHVCIIPNPIAFSPLRLKSLERPVIVTVGSAERLKNVHTSIRAFSLIRETIPSAELHIFGAGLDEASKFDVGSGVVCHGLTPHSVLMQFLEEHACLLIHPSLSETFGVIVGEAKMRGIPVIAGATTGGVDYVIGQVGGTLVDVRDPRAIADAALSYLLSPASFAAVQRQAHADIVNRFSLDRVTSLYLAAYARVLEAEAHAADDSKRLGTVHHRKF